MYLFRQKFKRQVFGGRNIPERVSTQIHGQAVGIDVPLPHRHPGGIDGAPQVIMVPFGGLEGAE